MFPLRIIASAKNSHKKSSGIRRAGMHSVHSLPCCPNICKRPGIYVTLRPFAPVPGHLRNCLSLPQPQHQACKHSSQNIPASVPSASSLPAESFVFFSPAAAKFLIISGAVKKFILFSPRSVLKQAQDPPVLIHIDLLRGRNLRKSGHSHNIPG